VTEAFFDNWVRWDFERSGTRRTLPYFYYDASSLSAVFAASSSKIKDLLPNPDMKPVEMVPGRCLVAITAFEYRKTDVNPYNEVSIAFLITFSQRQIPGITAARMMLSRAISVYVWQLPVTEEHDRAGGADLFGYPKFLADINFVREQDKIECTLAENGQEVLRLQGPRPQSGQGKPIRYITYAVEGGVPLVAEILVNPIEYAEAYNSAAVELRLGTEHPISEALREVELSRRALVYQYSPVNQAILLPARNLIGGRVR
jgi:hypothetical protein